VVRLNPQSATVEASVPGGDPVAVAAGEGGIWVANRETQTVTRIDPRSDRVVATIPIHNPPLAIAAGAGRVWVAVG
jgi:DNA-binding beta-propeller fold protein YncE